MCRISFGCVLFFIFSFHALGQLTKKDTVNHKSSSLSENTLTKFQLQQLLLLSNQQQLEISRNEQQKKMFEKQQLEIAETEKQILELRIKNKQNELERDRKAQAAILQQNHLKAELAAAVKDKQINRQQSEISNNRKWNLALATGIIIFAFFATVTYYSQLKTKKLNNLISFQHAELEQMGMVKDTILGVVSHDMRSPLNTLISFTELIREGNISTEKLGQYLDQINHTLYHTSSLMNNLLNWSASQMQGFKPVIEKVDAGWLMANIVDAFSERANAKKITISYTPATTMVIADANMLDLVLRNIVSNAIKYTENGGQIIMGVSFIKNEVVISVSDSGIGMTIEKMEQFNDSRLISTQSTPGTAKEKGTGLGLLICKTFSRLMNANIRVVRNEDEKRTVFEIILSKVTENTQVV